MVEHFKNIVIFQLFMLLSGELNHKIKLLFLKIIELNFKIILIRNCAYGK